VLVERPVYSGAVATIRPLGAHMVGIGMDGEGLMADEMDRVLTNWDEKSQGRKPKLLYTVPTGHNPSGITLSNPRRRAVYNVAVKHDLLICEDDPYYFVQLDIPESNQDLPEDDWGRVTQLTSFWSLDGEADEKSVVGNRVVRFDSASKILSAGLRIGWLTGPAPIVQRVLLHQQCSSIHPSSLSQTLVLSLMTQWGDAGLIKHIRDTVQATYRAKLKASAAACDKHLSRLATWMVPRAGMFLWLNLLNVDDSRALVEGGFREAGVAVVSGRDFSPNDEKSNGIRIAYSNITSHDQVDLAFSRLAKALHALSEKKEAK